MTNTQKPTDDLVDAIVDQLTLSIEEVADWHFLDVALQVDRNRPLVRLLVELVAPDREPVLDIREPESERDLAVA